MSKDTTARGELLLAAFVGHFWAMEEGHYLGLRELVGALGTPEEEARRAQFQDDEGERRLAEWRAMATDRLASITGGRDMVADDEDHRNQTYRRRGVAMSGGIALVPVHGPLSKRASMFSRYSGATSTDLLADTYDMLRQDERVEAVGNDIDSPGGEVSGVILATNALRQLGQVKPTFSVANELEASGAYWIGSAAGRKYAAPLSGVGSIGVFTTRRDWSAMEAEEGDVTHIVRAGKYKAEFHPSLPFTEDMRERLQAKVDQIYDRFVVEVAANRGISVEAARQLGDGAVYQGDDAVRRGYADEVATLDEALAIERGRTRGTRTVMAPARQAALAPATDVVAEPTTTSNTTEGATSADTAGPAAVPTTEAAGATASDGENPSPMSNKLTKPEDQAAENAAAEANDQAQAQAQADAPATTTAPPAAPATAAPRADDPPEGDDDAGEGTEASVLATVHREMETEANALATERAALAAERQALAREKHEAFADQVKAKVLPGNRDKVVTVLQALHGNEAATDAFKSLCTSLQAQVDTTGPLATDQNAMDAMGAHVNTPAGHTVQRDKLPTLARIQELMQAGNSRQQAFAIVANEQRQAR